MAACAVALALASCAGSSFAISTPWGQATTDDAGRVSIVIIPAK
jgi:hypothetical protein